MLSLQTLRKLNTSTLLPLAEYDTIIISYSGGKDSLACLLHLLELGADRASLELWHQHVDGEPGRAGLMDWPVTESYVQATGAALGIPVRFQWKRGGFEREMLREESLTAPTSFQLADGTIRTIGGETGKRTTRRRFPQVSADLSVRWCSPYLKIDPCSKAITGDPRFCDSKVLLVTGERREESAARSKYAEVEKHRTTNRRRRVDQWRPILDWSEATVWDIIERWRVRPHPAYQLGWGRVSCLACIFGGPDQWASVRDLAPARFDAIHSYELEFGSTIKKGESVLQQAGRGTSFVTNAPEELRRQAMGTQFSPEDFFLRPDEVWHRPAGAFRRCGGPS